MMRFLTEKALAAADLPAEAGPGTPFIEIYGKNRVYIENHKGIIQYTSDEIMVATKLYNYRISGEKLKIIRISDKNMVISGVVNQVQREER